MSYASWYNNADREQLEAARADEVDYLETIEPSMNNPRHALDRIAALARTISDIAADDDRLSAKENRAEMRREANEIERIAEATRLELEGFKVEPDDDTANDAQAPADMEDAG